MKVAEGDIRQLSDDPNFQRVVNQALTTRLIQKLSVSNKVLDSVKFHGNTPASLEKRIMNALVDDYLLSENYHLTRSVFESEACTKNSLEKCDIQGAFTAWQSIPISGKSTMASIVRQGVDSRSIKKSVSTQVDKSTADEVDYKLMQIEMDYADKRRLEVDGQRSRAVGVMGNEVARLRREMEAEAERKERAFKDREIQRMRVEEKARYDGRVKDLELRMERMLKEKLRIVRDREAETKLNAEEDKKHIEGMRTDVQRQLINQMSNLDRERAEFEDSKQREYTKFKSLDYKLDRREIDLLTKEKFVEVQDQLVQEAIDNKRQALIHSFKEKSSVDSRQQAIIDDLISKQEELKARLELRDTEVEKLLQEVKRREVENSDRFSKTSTLREENIKLRDVLNTQIEVSKRKDTTLGLYEKRIDSLVDENIKVKETLAELKKNWIMLGEARNLNKVSNSSFKPII